MPADPNALVVDLKSVTKHFGEQLILDGIDLQIRRGEIVALLGASGSGKTTLLRILASLDAANSGEVGVTDSRTVVFQEPRLVPFNRVWTNVLLGLPQTRANKAKAMAALREVGLEHKAEGWPRILSGGEAQRVALARALVRTPHLLLADEPFAALDALTRLRMQWLVQELWREHNPAILLVTHDVDEAVLLADRILVLKAGRLSVDLPVNLPRPRRSGHGFTELTEFLLAELGVLTDTDAGQPQTAPARAALAA
ncbi:MAG: transporter ATP-binding protein [Rhodoferax sp.]|nr:transporter ATP-binding protein [Rhodoferax sp.]